MVTTDSADALPNVVMMLRNGLQYAHSKYGAFVERRGPVLVDAVHLHWPRWWYKRWSSERKAQTYISGGSQRLRIKLSSTRVAQVMKNAVTFILTDNKRMD